MKHLRLWVWGLSGITAAAGFQLLSGSIAHAHDGINQGQNPFTAWNTDPTPTLLILVAAYLYITGLQRWNNPSHPVNFWQRASFFAGLFCIFLALQSPVDPIANHLQSFHQIQHLLLRMVAPLLIVLGAPLTPTLRGIPPWALQGIIRPAVRNHWLRQLYHSLTNPVVATLIFLAALVLWQIPPLHNLALRNDPVHQFMHLTMLFSGLLFWWVIIDPHPHQSRLHYGLRILYLGLIVIPNTVLGAITTFSGGLIYAAYGEVEQPFNMSLLTDQQLGGLILWVPSEMMNIIVAGIVMIMWYQQEQAQDSEEAAVYETNRPA